MAGSTRRAICSPAGAATTCAFSTGLIVSPSPSQPFVVQTEHLDADAAAWLAQRCRLVVCPYDDAALEVALAQADALIVRTYTIVDRAMLERAPRLKVVGRAGAGVDNIDVAACRA